MTDTTTTRPAGDHDPMTATQALSIAAQDLMTRARAARADAIAAADQTNDTYGDLEGTAAAAARAHDAMTRARTAADQANACATMATQAASAEGPMDARTAAARAAAIAAAHDAADAAEDARAAAARAHVVWEAEIAAAALARAVDAAEAGNVIAARGAAAAAHAAARRARAITEDGTDDQQGTDTVADETDGISHDADLQVRRARRRAAKD